MTESERKRAIRYRRDDPTAAELEATIAAQLLRLPKWWLAEQTRQEAARGWAGKGWW